MWGYISQANLKARVQFKDWVLSSGYDRYASGQVDTPWDGRFTADVGRGPETFQLQNWREGDYSSTIFYAKDDQGRDRAFVYVTTRKETVYELDTSQPISFDFSMSGSVVEGLRFSVAGETFEAYNCSCTGRTGLTDIYSCSFRDLQKRYRGSGSIGLPGGLCAGLRGPSTPWWPVPRFWGTPTAPTSRGGARPGATPRTTTAPWKRGGM